MERRPELIIARQGKHVHTYRGGDLGEEMSHIEGAVVVRRPDLTQAVGNIAPAHSLDFVKTLQSHFSTSRDSLLRYVVCFMKIFSEPFAVRVPLPVSMVRRCQASARSSTERTACNLPRLG